MSFDLITFIFSIFGYNSAFSVSFLTLSTVHNGVPSTHLIMIAYYSCSQSSSHIQAIQGIFMMMVVMMKIEGEGVHWNIIRILIIQLKGVGSSLVETLGKFINPNCLLGKKWLTISSSCGAKANWICLSEENSSISWRSTINAKVYTPAVACKIEREQWSHR